MRHSLQSLSALYLLFCLLLLPKGSYCVARFAIKSAGARSVVIEMVDAQNVNRFDMRVLIYDLERLREFRRSELTGARYNAQLFSFDGLLPANWFAFRIEYRLVYEPGSKKVRGTNVLDRYFGNDLSTKQELIVKTKPEVLGNAGGSPFSAESPVSSSEVQDEVVQFEQLQLFPELHQLNVTLMPVLKRRPRLNTLVVAELRCSKGTVKPQAQQLPDEGAVFSFDLARIHQGPLSHRNALATLKCKELCVFPFVRVEPSKAAEEQRHSPHKHTFRAREICELLEEDDPADFGDFHQGSESVMPHHQKLDRRFRTTSNGSDQRRAVFGPALFSLIISILFVCLSPQIIPS